MQEERADKFALNTMISPDVWKAISEHAISEQYLIGISKNNHIPMSFIVGRLAKCSKIKYTSLLYQKYANE